MRLPRRPERTLFAGTSNYAAVPEISDYYSGTGKWELFGGRVKAKALRLTKLHPKDMEINFRVNATAIPSPARRSLIAHLK